MIQKDIALLLETKLQTWGYLLSDSMEPEEINLFLDKGVNDFVDEVLTGLRNIGSFESNLIRLDELRKLKKTSSIIGEDSGSPINESWFTLPSDYRDYIKILLEITADCLTIPIYFRGRVVQEDINDELLRDTYHKSIIESPIIGIEDEKVIVYLNGFESKNLKITYIKSPEKFDLVNNGNVEYPLPDKSIYRIIDKVTLELAKVLEQNPQKIQLLQQEKLF